MKKHEDVKNEEEESMSKPVGEPHQHPSDAHVCIDVKKVEELTDTLKRLQAEFENYQKRAQKEMENRYLSERGKLIAKFLPILDSFEQALKNQDGSEFAKGIQRIYSQIQAFLHSEGLRPIECVGKPLDPYLHDVLMQGEGDKDNIILEELQRGYTLNGIVLRHAKVKISKKRDTNGNAADEGHAR